MSRLRLGHHAHADHRQQTATSCCRWPTRTASCTPSTATTWPPGRSGSTRSRSAAQRARSAATGRSPPASSPTARCTTPAATTCRTAHGSAAARSPRSTPAPARCLWRSQTEQPILGSPAYVNGMIGVAEGNTFEVLNAANGTLLYCYVLPALTYGAISVARSQFYVGDLNGRPVRVRPARLHHYPASRPELPDRLHLPGHPQPHGGRLRADVRRRADRDRGRHGHRAAPADQFRFISQPVTGDSQASTQITAQTAAARPGPAGRA